ncbi:hypothetical protein SAMN05421539_11926 [Jannaschia seohaensis]|uniref:Uncharacterized protein n=1 Tax=Jannaschia seohaensis TaxID=475081 RepID=A0A2Y9BB07_9RHOB|nr:hypothetical protein BCF38_11926 [Jannaschia seohaensis]SSA51439.1 hypothetical protein SAMN05421539_11926 [Jannaschia seohaensis]
MSAGSTRNTRRFRRPRRTRPRGLALLEETGFAVKKTLLRGCTFWNDCAKYPFSARDWAQRPLDALAVAGADTRRALSAKLPALMQAESVDL